MAFLGLFGQSSSGNLLTTFGENIDKPFMLGSLFWPVMCNFNCYKINSQCNKY